MGQNERKQTKHCIHGILFDLDGVLTTTDRLHKAAWTEICARRGVPFSDETASLLRGVGRLECAKIIMKRAGAVLTPEEMQTFAEEKNARYLRLLDGLTVDDRSPDVLETLRILESHGVPKAVASASKNAKKILMRIEIYDLFEAIIDGTQVTRSKPDPEVFEKAAQALKLRPEHCLVVEDAPSGIEAAKRIGCKTAALGPDARNCGADIEIENIEEILPALDGFDTKLKQESL